jgi:EAL domain-containing protein (putative c-di-GMP-specific phosphodiesterase class I)
MEKRHGMRSALEHAVRDSALLEQATCGPALPEQVAPDCSFTLAYQPIVALESGLIVGFEALLRWPHRTLGLLMPGQFIKIAEETGLIVPIGAWVIRRALCDLAAGGPYTGATHPYVSVNVSARQFRSPNFVGSVREALALSGLPSSALVLELTESAPIPHEGVAAPELAELTELGVRLAIDDFGTGYSSLSYLHELPIDILKIDRSFVEGFAVSHQRLAIVQGVISIARNLEIEVVAEGIETADQREMLAATGCDYGQGYLLAMPMEWAEAQHLLRSERALFCAARDLDAEPADYEARGASRNAQPPLPTGKETT